MKLLEKIKNLNFYGSFILRVDVSHGESCSITIVFQIYDDEVDQSFLVSIEMADVTEFRYFVHDNKRYDLINHGIYMCATENGGYALEFGDEPFNQDGEKFIRASPSYAFFESFTYSVKEL